MSQQVAWEWQEITSAWGRMGLWKRATDAVGSKAAETASHTVSSSELGFLLDPTVEQLLLALYQQVTASAGHFFVEVMPTVCPSPASVGHYSCFERRRVCVRMGLCVTHASGLMPSTFGCVL